MNFTVRIDKHNKKHVTFTVFANGANAGKLTLSLDEFSWFTAKLCQKELINTGDLNERL